MIWSAAVRQCVTPNERISVRRAWLIFAGWVTLWLAIWQVSHPAVFPAPWDVLTAVPSLWASGLGVEVWRSVTVNLEALAWSVAVSLPLAYASRVPVVAPIAAAVAKMRFLSPAVFFLLLLFALGDGHQVKVAMLAIGEIFFLVTSVVGIVAAIPESQLDDARTLRMSEWQIVWYVVVRGTLDQVIDAVRDNAAMGWSAVIMIEAIVRSEGGVGVLIATQDRHMNFEAVYAVAAVIVAVGIGQDYVIGWLRRVVCPYAVAA